MNTLFGMFKDDTGAVSSMRVVFVLVVLAVLVPAVIAAVKTGTPLSLSSNEMLLLGGALGGKLIQNGQEAPTPPTPPAK